MTTLNAFFVKYKVFLTGLAAAIAVTLTQLLSVTGHADDLKVYLYAAVMASLSYVATQWRGQAFSILGVAGTLAKVFVDIHNSGTFSWNDFILYSIIAIIGLAVPAPKPLSYEHNPAIVEAKTLPSPTVKDTSKLPIGGQTIKPNP